jgi:hypothetical protein
MLALYVGPRYAGAANLAGTLDGNSITIDVGFPDLLRSFSAGHKPLSGSDFQCREQ